MTKGYGFFWFPWKVPFVVTPDKKIFLLEVIDNVPYLRHDAHPVPARDVAEVKTTGNRQRSRGKPGGFGKIESWVLDSGAGHDLMSRCLANKKSVKKAEETLTFWTANGRTNAAQVCEEKLSVLNEKVKAYLLKDTPTILSLGVRCMQLGYGFYWFPYELPYLVCPSDGRHVQLQLDNFVPRLPARLDGTTVKLGLREVPVPWALSIAAPAFSETDRTGEEEEPSAEPGNEAGESESDDSEGSAEGAGVTPSRGGSRIARLKRA